MDSSNHFALLPPGGLTPPKGLNAAMEGLVREVLLKNPKDVYGFAAGYFEKLINIRNLVSADECEEINNLLHYYQNYDITNGQLNKKETRSVSAKSQRLESRSTVRETSLTPEIAQNRSSFTANESETLDVENAKSDATVDDQVDFEDDIKVVEFNVEEDLQIMEEPPKNEEIDEVDSVVVETIEIFEVIEPSGPIEGTTDEVEPMNEVIIVEMVEEIAVDQPTEEDPKLNEEISTGSVALVQEESSVTSEAEEVVEDPKSNEENATERIVLIQEVQSSATAAEEVAEDSKLNEEIATESVVLLQEEQSSVTVLEEAAEDVKLNEEIATESVVLLQEVQSSVTAETEEVVEDQKSAIESVEFAAIKDDSNSEQVVSNEAENERKSVESESEQLANDLVMQENMRDVIATIADSALICKDMIADAENIPHVVEDKVVEVVQEEILAPINVTENPEEEDNEESHDYGMKVSVETKPAIDVQVQNGDSTNVDSTPIKDDAEKIFEKCVTTIQKVFRGFMARKKLKDLFKNRKNTLKSAEHDQVVEDGVDATLYTVPEEKNDSSTEDESSTFSSAATKIQAGIRGYLTRKYFQQTKTNNSSDTTAPSIGEDSKSLEEIANNLESDDAVNKIIVATSSLIIEQLEHFEKLDSKSSNELDLLEVPKDDDQSNRMRKKLKREDAIQVNSPCSSDETNSNKYSPRKVSDEDEPIGDLAKSIITEIISSTGTQMDENIQDEADDADSKEDITDAADKEVSALISEAVEVCDSQVSKMLKNDSVQSDDCDVIVGSIASNKTQDDVIIDNNEQFEKKEGLIHSGEFHDAVLPTRISRSPPIKSKD